MLETGAGPRNFFRQVYEIHISGIEYQAHGYFGLIGIGNVRNNVLPNLFVSSDPKNLNGDSHQIPNFYVRVSSDMISNAIEGSIIKTSIKKLRLNRGEY